MNMTDFFLKNNNIIDSDMKFNLINLDLVKRKSIHFFRNIFGRKKHPTVKSSKSILKNGLCMSAQYMTNDIIKFFNQINLSYD